MLDSFIRLPNGANAAFYELRALSHAGVEAAVVIPRMNGIGTVGVVIAAPDGVPSEELLQQVQDDLDAVREIAVDVTVLAPEIQAVGVTAQLLPKRASALRQRRQRQRRRCGHSLRARFLERAFIEPPF